ncbi:MAG: DUF429 domain-containing protein [Phototrophicales bacterium]|nr:MAG: DUF429 domain-containing protein [Phototrophicales bacterium]
MIWGIDGCRAGWLGIARTANNANLIEIFPEFGIFWDKYGAEASRVLIDMTIGLPESGERVPDMLARQMLGARRASMFVMPVRAALDASTYQEAIAINQRITGKKFPKQTWNIVPRIREVNTVLRGDAHAQSVVMECHPEVAFCVLQGAPMAHSKKSGFGFYERLSVLLGYDPQMRHIAETARATFHPRDVADDDILDALVLLLCAGMEPLASLPDEPPRDAFGLPMRIVYPVL